MLRQDQHDKAALVRSEAAFVDTGMVELSQST